MLKRKAAPAFETVLSADGTCIAFERLGTGPAVILIGGASNDRSSAIAGVPHAKLLADSFCVYSYDRRGRGDSTDTAPFSVQREVEDIAALIEVTGVPVCVFGHSSGAALALEAAARLPIAKVAVYEPPYSLDAAADEESRAFEIELDALIAAGRNADAAVFFMEATGMPGEMIDAVRRSPQWPQLEALAPTLRYDVAVLREGGNSFVPRKTVERIVAPLLAMSGSASPDWMRQVAAAIAAAAPRGVYREFADQEHMIAAESVAPVLREFFGNR